jgi:hypothetical protein
MLKDGFAWLTKQYVDFASTEVVYARGYDSVVWPATFDRRLLMLDDGVGGLRMEWTDLDFAGPSAGLDFGDGPVTPQRGDLVYVTAESIARVFEVFPYGTDPCWQFADSHGYQIVVHTKFIAQEPYSLP